MISTILLPDIYVIAMASITVYGNYGIYGNFQGLLMLVILSSLWYYNLVFNISKTSQLIVMSSNDPGLAPMYPQDIYTHTGFFVIEAEV